MLRSDIPKQHIDQTITQLKTILQLVAPSNARAITLNFYYFRPASADFYGPPLLLTTTHCFFFRSSIRYRSTSCPTKITSKILRLIAALPDEGPKITGGKVRYQIGDMVRVNCTSGRSKPAVQLNWMINGEPADPKFLRGPETITTGREGLETTILGKTDTMSEIFLSIFSLRVSVHNL